MSNIIKSTRVSILSSNKYNIKTVPLVQEKELDEVISQKQQIEEILPEIDEQQIIELAQQKAEETIAAANEQAKEIVKKAVADANEQADKIREEAQNIGYDNGYNSGLEQVEKLKDQAQLELEDALRQKQEIIGSCEPLMVDMVMKVSKTILGKALEVNPQIILLLIKKGIDQVSTKSKVYIHISKDDYEKVSDNLAQIYEFASSEEIELIKDLSLNQGYCIIETPFGNVDSSLDMQFDEIKKDIHYILENR